jgi:hypothetical protein
MRERVDPGLSVEVHGIHESAVDVEEGGLGQGHQACS